MPHTFEPGDRVIFTPRDPETNGVHKYDGVPIGMEGIVTRRDWIFVDVKFPITPWDPESHKASWKKPKVRLPGDEHIYHMLPGELEAI